ncbi:Lipase precursor [Labilithrix luteola]|uniref:Lipase n=1 Tax=Labilithrix luteola TaxID=1391654 RepID=A0A0K1Q7J5_9BACT|nr:Lipase precursor [Labilithrix luteola]
MALATAVVGCAADEASDKDDACATAESCATSDAITNVAAPFTVGRVEKTNYPIILHHGFNASSTNSWSYYGVKQALEADGHHVTVTEVEPFAGVATRAKRLAVFVDRALDEHCTARVGSSETSAAFENCLATAKVNLVAHSMGGLDARYLASSLGYASKIASITTISTPHGGSAIADVGLHFISGEGKFSDAIDALASAFGRTFTEDDLATNTDLHAALLSLSEKNAPAFDAENPDQAGIYYQSYAGVSRAIGGPRTESQQREVLKACNGIYFGTVARADFMALQLTAGSLIVGGLDFAPQDGMVTVEHAKRGNFRGCFPSDHLDEVGQVRKDRPDVYTKFDHLAFYRVLATDLAKRGF